MSLFDPAPLTDALLVTKGGAAPSRYTMPRNAPVAGPRRPRDRDIRARLALRLDEKRHRRLRLAAAHLHMSGQALLLAALDHYLDHVVPARLDQRCTCLESGATPSPSCPAHCP